MNRLVGVGDTEDSRRVLLAVGVRELVAALRSRHNDQRRLRVTIAATVGAMLVDLIASARSTTRSSSTGSRTA